MSPSKAQTMGDLVERGARAYADSPALIFYDEIVTYRNLFELARETARRMLGSGLQPGDRVATWLPNGTPFVATLFGAALAGLTLVPLNTRFKILDAADSLRKSGARALFFNESFLGIDFFDMVQKIRSRSDLPELELVVNMGDNGAPGILPCEKWRRETKLVDLLPSVDPDSPATINFTSGTTASPKGAVISHQSLLRTAREVGARMGITRADRMVTAMPFYHNGGMVVSLTTCLISGCALYSQPRFDPDYVLDTITRDKCTIMSGVGTMYIMMINSPALMRADLSSVRCLRMTAPADMRRAAHELFRNAALYSLYGMTESTAAATLTLPTDSVDEQVETNGKPLPSAAIRIVDANGQGVSRETKGEIWIGGKSIMKGYYRDPQATAQVLTPDGWLRSGDLGYIDARGNTVLIGRQKDMYRSGGENVACGEVEELLRTHPAVLHAAIFGVPDPRMDEVGLALIELHPGATATEQEIQDFCRQNFANFKVPRYVMFCHDLPMTASGRVQKFRMRDQALEFVESRSNQDVRFPHAN